MKISPISSGGGMPGVDLGGASAGRTSPDRLESARRVAAGQEPMDRSQIDPQAQRAQDSIRKIKMRTNYSPDRQFEVQPEVAQSAITETNEQSAQSLEETKPLSPQCAALAKQRRALQQERQIFEQEKAKALESTAVGGIDPARVKSDPLGVLREAGVLGTKEFYDSMTKYILEGGAGTNQEILDLQSKLSSVEEKFDKTLSERDQQQEQQVLAQIQREADQLVATGDEFKYTRAMKSAAKATELIHKTWKATGEILDTTEALGLIEAECKKDYDALTSALTPAQAAQAAIQQQQSQGMRTLTNRDTARAQPMSRRDRMIAAALGQLKR